MARTYQSLVFEDVGEGDALPELVMPITMTRCLMAASAGRDWQRVHHDREYAQRTAGTRDLFLGTWFYMGILTRFATDWAGPTAFVSSLEFTMKVPLHPGDEMQIQGTVVGRRVEAGRYFVDLDVLISNQFGPTTPARLSVILPSRTG
jgi:acyl dehydratase